MTRIDFNPYNYEFHEDPYPTYALLREQAPLYHNPELGFFALSRHADVLAGFKDTAGMSNAMGVTLDPAATGPQAEYSSSFLAMDPPRHTRMRGLVSRAFTPRRVAQLEPSIRALAENYLTPFEGRRDMDVVGDFAARLPMDVVSELLDVPSADRDELRTAADAMLHREEGMQDVTEEGVRGFLRLREYFTELINRRRKQPGSDLISALFEAEIDGEQLTDNEVVAFCNLMIVAGNETTTKLIANCVYWLSQSSDQRVLVAQDPSLIPDWVEETLRYDNSTQIMARSTTRNLRFSEGEIPAGSRVLLLIGSANRDPAVFDEPDRFDVRRQQRDMLSFGHGAHFCLGASLARLEARVSLEELWRRFPDFEVDTENAARVHSVNVRGFSSLPLRL